MRFHSVQAAINTLSMGASDAGGRYQKLKTENTLDHKTCYAHAPMRDFSVVPGTQFDADNFALDISLSYYTFLMAAL